MKTVSALPRPRMIIVIGLLIGLSPAAAFAAGPVAVNKHLVKGMPNAVLRTIPKSLHWSCIRLGDGEYKCTDPKTGESYVCSSADASGDRVCDVGNDKIAGSRP